MSSEHPIDPTQAPSPGAPGPRSNARRRLLRAGIGASPVVLSVVSQPVRAALGPTKAVCRSASAFASFNANPVTSHNPTDSCTGNGPVAWKSLPAIYWPSGALAIQGRLFVSSGTSYSVSKPGVNPGDAAIIVSTPTIYEVVMYGAGSSPRDALALNIAAANLNLAAGYTPANVILNAGVLETIWHSAGPAGGTYPVNSGVAWNAVALNTWLRSTFVTN